nr:zinc finger, CCHC-type [Tanacetum cinerariifolium]
MLYRIKGFDSGCSRHMTGNKSYFTDYHEIDGGFVAFGGNSKGEYVVDNALFTFGLDAAALTCLAVPTDAAAL